MSEPFSVTLDQDSFRSHRTDIPSLDVSVTKENLLEWYRQMASMRRMEQAADALYRAKLIRGFCHLAIGQVSPSWHKILVETRADGRFMLLSRTI